MSESEKRIAVKVDNLTKTFRIPTEASNGIKQKFINILKNKKGYREFTPLKDISFEIEEGDFFGIVGKNGSGKSTLLKSIANIYTPNKGEVHVRGTLVPFIELGVGFNPELTGRENVYLNGALLGFSRKEVEAIYDEIVEFAEIGNFMDEKLKNYSSGMQVRLAFSIAIKAEGDVLLLDEVLAVGDEAFQRKCFEYFAQLKRNKKTVILVTHDMNSVARFCNKAMLIDKGQIKAFGDIKKVVRGYEKLNEQKVKKEKTNSKEKYDVSRGTIETTLNGAADTKLHKLSAGKELHFDLLITPKEDMKDVFLGFTIQRSSGEYVYWYTTELDKVITSLQAGKQKRVSIKMQNIFGNGQYSVNVNVKKVDRTIDYIVVHDAVKFEVTGWDRAQGWMFHPTVEAKELSI